MRIADFDYDLPSALIAQHPTDRRDASRLMVVRARGVDDPRLEHRRFGDLPDLLAPGDVLVVNDARVLPARLMVRRPTGGRVELLFLGPAPDGAWRVLARPARRVRAGDLLEAADGTAVEILAEAEVGERTVRAHGRSIVGLLESEGAMPLPPYIRRDGSDPAVERLDRERYQTVYARAPGAVAAPTAGLHFTPELLGELETRGIAIEKVTLHVGAGTFRPVTAERVEEHQMEVERYEIDESTAARLTAARRDGRRVVAVGTTVVRTLEHAWSDRGLRPGAGVADLFITPGYRFRLVDAMITNFHLPRSTPVLMVAAMIGRDPLLAAYREAVRREYRFYSYGDAMLVIPTGRGAGTLPG